MVNIFEWDFDSDLRFVIQFLTVITALAPYIYLIVMDFKYRSMEYWKILAAAGINLIMYIPIAIWVDKLALIFILGIPLLFVPLSVLNGKINKERIVGQADVDVAIIQILISLSIVFLSSRGITDDFAMFLNLTILSQMILVSIFLGLLMTFVIWVVIVIVQKLRTKDALRKVMKDNREVPTLIAFLPWVFINMYIGMGIF